MKCIQVVQYGEKEGIAVEKKVDQEIDIINGTLASFKSNGRLHCC